MSYLFPAPGRQPVSRPLLLREPAVDISTARSRSSSGYFWLQAAEVERGAVRRTGTRVCEHRQPPGAHAEGTAEPVADLPRPRRMAGAAFGAIGRAHPR